MHSNASVLATKENLRAVLLMGIGVTHYFDITNVHRRDRLGVFGPAPTLTLKP